MRVKFNVSPFAKALLAELPSDYIENYSWDEIIRRAGYPSCIYVSGSRNGGYSGHWEMDEVEYTWFVLRWS